MKELTITRFFDAPIEEVFDAWIDPIQVAEWWGPKGYTNPVSEVDARPGGEMNIQMRSPEGVVHPVRGVFHEVVRPYKIVVISSAFENDAGMSQLEVRNTVRFDNDDGKTKLTLFLVVMKATPEVSEALAGMEDGWGESLDRLTEYLADRP